MCGYKNAWTTTRKKVKFKKNKKNTHEKKGLGKKEFMDTLLFCGMCCQLGVSPPLPTFFFFNSTLWAVFAGYVDHLKRNINNISAKGHPK